VRDNHLWAAEVQQPINANIRFGIWCLQSSQGGYFRSTTSEATRCMFSRAKDVQVARVYRHSRQSTTSHPINLFCGSRYRNFQIPWFRCGQRLHRPKSSARWAGGQCGRSAGEQAQLSLGGANFSRTEKIDSLRLTMQSQSGRYSKTRWSSRKMTRSGCLREAAAAFQSCSRYQNWQGASQPQFREAHAVNM
jgi:hypothetical protein